MPDSLCYIETADLDKETKSRRALATTSKMTLEPFELESVVFEKSVTAILRAYCTEKYGIPRNTKKIL